MNKLAQYLNQHLVGEVVTDKAVLERFSTDNSPLKIVPEMIVYPRTTNDIRKLARFSWQLAEKGHILPLTARGFGTDTTGASIGQGVIISLSSHMNNIFECDPKQRLIRLQPGVSLHTTRNALKLVGLDIPNLQFTHSDASLGGIVAASNSRLTHELVERLEVVLSSGDVIQTSRISKKELHRKKGQEGFEADIYRAVDTLIEEHDELIQSLDTRDGSGYSGLKNVKNKDGSIDLSPLLIGSQGTLGIISEMIIKADYTNEKTGVVIASFDDAMSARDAVDEIRKVEPGNLEYYDNAIVERAARSGKKYEFATNSRQGAVLIALFNDVSERTQIKKMKKIAKLFGKLGVTFYQSDDLYNGTFANVLSLKTASALDDDQSSLVPLIDGAYIPSSRFEDFSEALSEFANKHRVSLPLYGLPLDEVWYARPSLNLKTIGGKQAVLKLVDEYARLVSRFGGYIAGEYGEGRLQSLSARREMDDEVTILYAKLKSIFDPNNILNTGAKADIEVKQIASMIRNEYTPQHADALSRM